MNIISPSSKGKTQSVELSYSSSLVHDPWQSNSLSSLCVKNCLEKKEKKKKHKEKNQQQPDKPSQPFSISRNNQWDEVVYAQSY